ncbi:influenza virus NS1A-binding protein homolog A-like [Homarus americanus]|uniref:influenza virus NS1A-binding protein homolog A-like n=1 Tax=Homarus americanus TaxID=6706 RepID=UPI001C480EED|nr:influenza virus NS1A-binding protein homolog A-like [Homarus americanus]
MHDLLSYNPVTGEWRALAGRAPPRYNYMGVAVLNNFLYLVGGLLFNEEAEKSLERYSFEQNKWFKFSSMNFDRSIPAVVATNSLLYVIGGHRQNNLNRLEDDWTGISSMVTPRCHFGLCAHEGYLYAFGGRTKGCDDISPNIERYDPFADEWRLLESNMPKVISHGRMDSYNPFHELLSYNPVTGEWRDLAALSAPPRYNYMGVAVLNNFLYLVGGLFNEEGEKSLERYSFEQNEWFKCSSMNFWRSIPAVVATNSLLYIIGGHRPNDHLELNQWFKCSSSEYLGRSSPAVVVTNSLLYVIGGYWSGLNGIGMVRKED